MNDTYRPLILLALGGFCLSLLSFAIWILVNEGNDGFAVGRVAAIATSSITVADPFQAQTVVLISDATRITQEGKLVSFDTLSTESYVRVTGEVVDHITIAATAVQLLRPPKHKRTEYED